MAARDSKRLMAHYFEGFWQSRREDVADEVLAPDVVLHGLEEEIRAGVLPPGPDAEKVMLRRIVQAFPDMQVAVDHLIGEGELVAVNWHATGTHLGEFDGIPPTGRLVTMRAMSLSRVVEGRMVEGWMLLDRMGLARELGLMPQGAWPAPIARAASLLVRVRDGRWRLPRAAAPAAVRQIAPPPSRPGLGLEPPPATIPSSRAVIARHLEQAWGRGEPSVALGPELQHGSLAGPPARPGRAVPARAGGRFRTACPTRALDVHQIVAEDDMVAAHWSMTAAHLGDLNGFPATGRRVTATAMGFFRLEDGRIVESWQELDEMGLAQDLGLFPRKPMPAPVARMLVSSIRRRDRAASRRTNTPVG